MLRAMLETVVVAAADIVAVKVVVPIKVVVVINIDVAAAVPVAITPPSAGNSGANNHARAPGKSHSGIVTRISVGVIRVSGRTVDNGRVVRRNIDDTRISLLNHDHLLVARASRFYHLFLAGL